MKDEKWYLIISGLGLIAIYKARKIPDQWLEWADSGNVLIPASGEADIMRNVLMFRRTLLSYSWKHMIDPALISAIIHVESEGYSNAGRPQSDPVYFGLMQISFQTAKNMGYVGDKAGLYIPDTNMKYGTKYLKYQYDRYKNDIMGAISAYNAGHSLCSGLICGNQTYVNAIMRITSLYRMTYGFLWNYNWHFPSSMYDYPVI